MQIDIQKGLHEILESKKRTFPQHVNRISALDEPCLKRLYYMRAAWDKASPIEDGLQGVFETGNLLEPVIQRIVSEVGHASNPRWRIVGSQTTTNDNLLKEYQISGTIDGFLQIEGGDKQWITQGVIDIKTMSPNIFPQIHDYSSLGKYPWTRKYRGQLQLYALAHNLEWCYILCVNKSNLYNIKLIDFPLDLSYCDSLLEKAKTINAAIEAGNPPIGINSPDACHKCQFFSFCTPDISTGGNLQISDNDELEQILERMGELESGIQEYKELKKARDAILVKGQDLACGQWLILWKKVEVDYKPKPAAEARTVCQWRKTISKAGKPERNLKRSFL